jgi:hypothetical protein
MNAGGRAQPIGPVSGAAARKAAQTELDRPRYHRDDPSVVTRVLDWLGRRLGSIVSGGASGSATLILLVLLAAVITFAVIRAGRPRRLARQLAGNADPLAPDATLDHRQRAIGFEQQGRLADAMREWLRATVEAIEARGILEARPGRTAASIALEAGSALPTIAADLQAVIEAFDQVWFGARPATAVDVANARRLADAVHTARVTGATLSAGSFGVPV